VKYLYEQASEPQALEAPLSAQMLDGLPKELLGDLREALESLEPQRINAVIQRIDAHDQSLKKLLIHFVEDFNYPAILQVLQNCK
jgi:predicted Zn-dependent peptidase